jgi:hypothetical protein
MSTLPDLHILGFDPERISEVDLNTTRRLVAANARDAADAAELLSALGLVA